MNKKQTMGLLIAAIIFVAVAVTSVLVNAFADRLRSTASGNSFMNSFYGSGSDFSDMPMGDFVAIVPIEGTIQANQDTGGMFSTPIGYNHNMLINYVDTLMKTSNNKGIVLRLNTPGGTVYESDELYLKLMEYKEKTGRPIWAYMESQCCSGGVYIASAADEQFANRNAWTGSIGVIISTYDMTGLYEKLGIKEINITSGANKAMGSSGEEMTQEQVGIFQSMVDETYNIFVNIVADSRNMTTDQVKQLADGRLYTAQQAVDNKLIDGIKTYEEFKTYVMSNIDSSSATFYEPASPGDYFSYLFGSAKQLKEKSEMEAAMEFIEGLESGVPMYYAKPIGE